MQAAEVEDRACARRRLERELRRLEALALLGIGYRRLSITPAAVGPIKELVRKVDLAELTEHMKRLLASPPEDMRAELHKWASERDIDLD